MEKKSRGMGPDIGMGKGKQGMAMGMMKEMMEGMGGMPPMMEK